MLTIDKYLIPSKLDRRCKLTRQQKQDIMEMYESGNYSQRQLAREFNVSRRLITFCIDPLKLENNKLARAKRGGSKQYYNTDKWYEYMQDHRKYKKELLVKNKLIKKGSV